MYHQQVPLYMDREFFQNKISKLDDSKLIDLLRTTHNSTNSDIFILVTEEMERRNLKFDWADANIKSEPVEKSNDLTKLNKWNWGAFLLAPIWASANRLEWWAI